MAARNTAFLARLCVVAAIWCGGSGAVARAQTLPAGPVTLADGRLTIGGDATATFGSSDPAFFDYTDYEHSALRMLRVNLSAALQAGEHFTILGDVQSENLDNVRPYAFYVRVRPWTSRNIDIQAGRVPPTFGAFARRTYATDNPLIGYPLAYQYLTSLRPDALPATADELLQKKGVGWLVRYSTGQTAADHGVPLVSAFRWDTGVQVHAAVIGKDTLTATGSITTGTVSDPRVSDNNGGRQAAGRVEWRPTAAIVAGASVARGAFVSSSAISAAHADARADDFTQTAWGADLEFSRDYLLVRAETIVSEWRVPFDREPARTDPLRAMSGSIEGRYKIRPGFYVAARVDHLDFNRITGTLGSTPWDAPVTRFEAGGGYSIQRNLLVKFAYQRNTRDGGRLATKANHVATQVVFWF